MSDARPPLSSCPSAATATAGADAPTVQDTASPDTHVVSLVTSLSRANLAAQFSEQMTLAVIPIVAVIALRASAEQTVGAALSVYGFGMVCGAMGYARIAQRLSFGRQILLGPVCAAVAALTLASTSVLSVGDKHGVAHALVFIAFFLFGFGPIVWTISTTSLRQVVTPGGLNARVSAATMTATFGARPLGAFLSAWVASSLGIKACLIAMVLGFALQLTIILRSPAARLRTLSASVAVVS
ncbi:MFS transporter [Pandoraea oxalativorans]|uniref:Uncharacterized protein n=1 Tax=Pandoraea oxalativorans TaxID=573737 RepID=A0A192B126_9BURK|nr:MFS transporter [Pandoraea oxalativorans]ANJ87096.1 hypothetical protein MB84_26365 [Pandoraea oxalativorans]